MAPMHDLQPKQTPDPAPGLWQTWGRGPILALVIFLMLANLTGQLLVYGLGGGLLLPPLAGALLGVLLPLAMLQRQGQLVPATDLGAGRPAPATLAVAGVFALAGLAPSSLLAEFSLRLHPVDPQWAALYNEQLPLGLRDTLVAVVSVVVVAPLAEEIVFRALLQRLAAGLWGRVPGLIVGALVFGIVHGEPWYIFGLIGVGLVLGVIWDATGSLAACWLAHALHNAVSLAALQRGPGISLEPAVYGTGDWLLVGGSCLVLAAAGGILLRSRPPRTP